MSEFNYAMFFTGVNYGAYDVENPADAIMVESIADAVDTLKALARNYCNAETGDGSRIADTPCFGEPGDYAVLFPVPREGRTYGPELHRAGARARAAYALMLDEMTSHDGIRQDLDPAYVMTFGPRGGVGVERH